LLTRFADSVCRESQQTALQESVSQAHMPPPVVESTECMSAEEVLLPKKWKVVLMTLRAMLDRRPEIEDILQVCGRLLRGVFGWCRTDARDSDGKDAYLLIFVDLLIS
jgi:hypothetical protein